MRKSYQYAEHRSDSCQVREGPYKSESVPFPALILVPQQLHVCASRERRKTGVRESSEFDRSTFVMQLIFLCTRFVRVLKESIISIGIHTPSISGLTLLIQ